MNDLIKTVIEIDNKLYEKVMKKKYNEENQGRAGFISEKLKGNFHKEGNRFSQGHANQDLYKPASMELDSTEQKSCKETICREKQGNNRKDKMCYECDKSGHFARDCHNKVQQQLNMTTKCREFNE